MKQESPILRNIALGVGILAVLIIIPFTRDALALLGSFILSLILWILLLFALVWVTKWAVVKFSKKKK